RFEVIGDDDLGDATEGGKGPDMGTDPVGQTLGPGGLGIGIVRGTQDRHEDRHFMHFPAVAVDYRNALPGVIYKELLPSAVGLAHNQIKFLRPGSIGVTKPAILQAVGRGRLISCHSRNNVTPLRLSSRWTVDQSGTRCGAGTLVETTGNSNRSNVPSS